MQRRGNLPRGKIFVQNTPKVSQIRPKRSFVTEVLIESLEVQTALSSEYMLLIPDKSSNKIIDKLSGCWQPPILKTLARNFKQRLITELTFGRNERVEGTERYGRINCSGKDYENLGAPS